MISRELLLGVGNLVCFKLSSHVGVKGIWIGSWDFGAI